MINLVKETELALMTRERPRYRDRRGHYASGALRCLRDQYWQIKGVPKTNPPDFWGMSKMLLGDATEYIYFNKVLNNLATQEWRLVGTQTSVGGTDPSWDGYLDGLFRKIGTDQYHVVEMKSKSGYGATMMFRNPQPSDDNLAQIGLYLKDLSEKGVTNEGSLFYVLLSDGYFGHLIQVPCVYDPDTMKVNAQYAIYMDGTKKKIDKSFDICYVMDRWKKLDNCVEKNIVPKPDYEYMYDLTPEVLRQGSDAQLKKIGDEQVVYGDWQVLYSPYLDLQLETDGLTRRRSDEDILKVYHEYKRRHPRAVWKPERIKEMKWQGKE